jgi:hypothetical protein
MSPQATVRGKLLPQLVTNAALPLCLAMPNRFQSTGPPLRKQRCRHLLCALPALDACTSSFAVCLLSFFQQRGSTVLAFSVALLRTLVCQLFALVPV